MKRSDAVCARDDLHTPMPTGYVEFMDRAAELAKTHRQERCPCCHRWSIWLPRASFVADVLKDSA